MRKLKRSEKNEIASAFSLIMGLGINLIVVTIICLFIGNFLDNFFDTSPLFIIIFFFVAIITSFRNIYVVAMGSINAKDKDNR